MATSEGGITHETREAARRAMRASARAAFEVHALGSRGHLTVLLGTTTGGRALSYDESAHVFLLGGRLCSLADVRELDACAQVRWRYLEQRDWMRRLDAKACDCALERELERLGQTGGVSGLDEQIRQHVKKNDSYLHGHIVDTNAEEAVAEALAREEPRGGESGKADAPALASETLSGAKRTEKEKEEKRRALARRARSKVSGIKMKKNRGEEGLQ